MARTYTSRRRFLVGGAAALGVAVLAACGGTPAPTAAPAKPADTKSADAPKPAQPAAASKAQVNLNWITPAGVGLERDFYTSFMQDYEKRNPHVKIQVSFEGWNDYFVKLPTVLASGSIPDAIHLHGSIAQDYGLRGAVKDLFQYMKRDDVDKNLYFEPLIQQMADYKTGTKLWALPKDSAAYAFYINKEMLEKAGVPFPKREWTFQEFRDIAKKLTKDKAGKSSGEPGFDPGSIVQWGISWSDPLPSSDGWQMTAWGVAGPWYNENYTKAFFDNPDHVNFLQAVADMRNKDRSIPTAGDALGQGDPWRNGLTAMKIAHHADVFFYNAEKKTFPFDVTYAPGGPKGQYQGVACSGFTVPTKAPNADEGWNFVKFLCSEEKQCEIVKAKRWGSAVKPCEQNLLPEDNNPPSFKEVLVDPLMGQSKVKTQGILYPPFLSDMKQIWQTEYDPVFNGGTITAAEAGKKAQPQIQALLDKAAQMPLP